MWFNVCLSIELINVYSVETKLVKTTFINNCDEKRIALKINVVENMGTCTDTNSHIECTAYVHISVCRGDAHLYQTTTKSNQFSSNCLFTKNLLVEEKMAKDLCLAKVYTQKVIEGERERAICDQFSSPSTFGWLENWVDSLNRFQLIIHYEIS